MENRMTRLPVIVGFGGYNASGRYITKFGDSDEVG